MKEAEKKLIKIIFEKCFISVAHIQASHIGCDFSDDTDEYWIKFRSELKEEKITKTEFEELYKLLEEIKNENKN